MFEVMGQAKKGGLGKQELELASGAQALHRTGRFDAIDGLACREQGSNPEKTDTFQFIQRCRPINPSSNTHGAGQARFCRVLGMVACKGEQSDAPAMTP